MVLRMRLVAVILASSLAVAVGGAARADELPEQESRRVVDRPLLLPKKSFGIDAQLRGADGVDGAMFEYLFAGLEVGTGSGVTDIKFGMDLLLSQPNETDLDLLEKVYVRIATGVGTGGITALTFRTYQPTLDEAVKPQILDLTVMFKRAVASDIAVLAGGGFDFTYFLFPEDADPGESFWVTRFHLSAGGQLQLTPSFAAEATGSVYIPLAQNPDEDEGGFAFDVTLQARARGYYTLSSTFDLYVELSFNSDDELLASIGETQVAMLGVKGWL